MTKKNDKARNEHVVNLVWWQWWYNILFHAHRLFFYHPKQTSVYVWFFAVYFKCPKKTTTTTTAPEKCALVRFLSECYGCVKENPCQNILKSETNYIMDQCTGKSAFVYCFANVEFNVQPKCLKHMPMACRSSRELYRKSMPNISRRNA